MADLDFGIDTGLRFTPADDSVHEAGSKADWTETTWWSFFVPERSLGGWLYVQMRPNLGTCAGGAFVYDPTAWLPWELPYCAYQHHQPLPEPLDLTDVTFRNGVSVRCLEPGMRYELGYGFRDETDFTAELEFEGLTPPVPHLAGAPPFTGSSHYDQHGRVRGTLGLRGERIEVDSYAVRDRSWGRRPELLGRRPRLSYWFATSPTGDEAFLAFCQTASSDPLGEVEHVTSGYLLRGGVLRRLARGERRTRRDPSTGGVASIQLEASDVDGRSLHVEGHAVSRMALPTDHVTINTMTRCAIDGREAWGEDQEVWSTALFADARRR